MNPNLVSALTGYFPYLGPEELLGGAACVLFLGGTWRANRNLWGGVALASLAAAALVAWLGPRPSDVGVGSCARPGGVRAGYLPTGRPQRCGANTGPV